ncbi:glycosyltransferase, partial [bacterium]
KEDRELTSMYFPAERIHVVENGVDCSQFVPQADRPGTANRLLFTGTSTPRNMIALHEFAENILPLIMATKPEVKLIVGGDFSLKAQQLFRHLPCVEFTGRVEDMRPVLNSCDLFVAPFGATHGSKLKIAEAMAMGLCIVSTPEGIRGFQLKSGESVVVARSNSEFADQVVSLLANPERRMRIGENARRIALETIDWNLLGFRLQSIVDDVLDGKEIPIRASEQSEAGSLTEETAQNVVL